MKLQVGKTYLSRQGGTVKIIKKVNDDRYPYVDAAGRSYTDDGSYRRGRFQDLFDLVEEVVEEIPEITLRDKFALAALPVIYGDFCSYCREHGAHPSTENWRESIASEAYGVADAMLRARHAKVEEGDDK